MKPSPAAPSRSFSDPWIEASLPERIGAIEALVASRYWSLLPQRVQDNWQRQLNDLRGQMPPVPCSLPFVPVTCQ